MEFETYQTYWLKCLLWNIILFLKIHKNRFGLKFVLEFKSDSTFTTVTGGTVCSIIIPVSKNFQKPKEGQA